MAFELCDEVPHLVNEFREYFEFEALGLFDDLDGLDEHLESLVYDLIDRYERAKQDEVAGREQ